MKKSSSKPKVIVEEEKKSEESPTRRSSRTSPAAAVKESKRKVICFYRERDEWGEFSNFLIAPIQIDGKLWPSTEHYFQAMKFPTRPDY